jgi:serine/threonine-protein phosphatase PP1-1
MPDSKIPQPGPAKLKRNAGPDEWLEAAKDCKYLSEPHMKQLCEIVKEYMMEGKQNRSVASFSRTDMRRIQYPTSLDTGHGLW